MECLDEIVEPAILALNLQKLSIEQKNIIVTAYIHATCELASYVATMHGEGCEISDIEHLHKTDVDDAMAKLYAGQEMIEINIKPNGPGASGLEGRGRN